MQLTGRQQEITRIVRENGPITGEMIAQRLHVTRSALRGDLAVLLAGTDFSSRGIFSAPKVIVAETTAGSDYLS